MPSASTRASVTGDRALERPDQDPVAPQAPQSQARGDAWLPGIVRDREGVPERQVAPGPAGARVHPEDESAAGGRFTACAGLFFLLPVMERLGMSRWLDDHPSLLEAGFPARLLQSMGERVGLEPHDPLWLALEEIGTHEPLPALTAWPEAVRALLATPPPRGALDSPVDVWLAAVRRWCRRNARMGLISAIRRPGRLFASRTHLEIGFHVSQLDLRIRRSALDVDPGWVPWLGRVVRFHYLDPEEQRG